MLVLGFPVDGKIHSKGGLFSRYPSLVGSQMTGVFWCTFRKGPGGLGVFMEESWEFQGGFTGGSFLSVKKLRKSGSFHISNLLEKESSLDIQANTC